LLALLEVAGCGWLLGLRDELLLDCHLETEALGLRIEMGRLAVGRSHHAEARPRTELIVLDLHVLEVDREQVPRVAFVISDEDSHALFADEEAVEDESHLVEVLEVDDDLIVSPNSSSELVNALDVGVGPQTERTARLEQSLCGNRVRVHFPSLFYPTKSAGIPRQSYRSLHIITCF
jgi:hypothetical protein